jgi:hypothetical protein
MNVPRCPAEYWRHYAHDDQLRISVTQDLVAHGAPIR